MIRLHSDSRRNTWNEQARWKSWDPTLRIELGNENINSLIASSRLIVHSYVSIGILITLASNIPTLAFWQNDYDHLRDSVIPFYQVLVDAGIIHFSPGSISRAICEAWHDVDAWWKQVKIQQARVIFCENYAKISDTPIDDLIQIFNC